MAIEYDVRDRVAYIAFCRPEKHNALRDEDISDLVDALGRLDGDDRADVGIIHGQGRSFSSGADVGARLQASIDDEDASDRTNETDAILDSASNKPLIAAVHGYCLGHALGTALICDHIVAERSAKFRVVETALGIPMVGVWYRLGRTAFANDVMMTGRYFSGEEAARVGLVTRLVEDGDHLAGAEQLANEILQNPQSTVRELVRARRASVAARDREAREAAGTFDWVGNPEAAERIKSTLARVEQSGQG